MVAFGTSSGDGTPADAASVTDSGYAALIVILLLMSLPGIAGPLMMRRRLIDRG